MIPTKNRLAIKQYIRDKPVRWGIKRFLLCEAKTGYILDAEIYTGWVKDRHWPILGSGSVVRRLVENSQVTNKNHMLFMDRFYNSVALFHLLKNELGVLAAGTGMPSHKHYPKELGRRLTERGRYVFPVPGSSVWPGVSAPSLAHTSGPLSLKNQLHSTWPPRPHSLAGWPRTHSGGEGAHRPPGSDQNVTPLVSSLLRPSLLVNFRPFLSLWPFKNTSEKNQAILFD